MIKSQYHLRSGYKGGGGDTVQANGTPSDVDSTHQNAGSTIQSSRTPMIVFLILVIDLLAFTMILPLLPSLLDYYSQHDRTGLYTLMQSSVDNFRDFLGIPDTEKYNAVLFGGVIGSLFSFLQFVASPVIGAASDKYGRRPLMILTTIGIAVSYAIWAVSYNFSLFVLARVIGGISKGNVSLCTTIVTDVSSTKTRGKGMALIGMAFSIGFIVGPVIGAYFARGSSFHPDSYINHPAILALTLGLLDILIVFFLLKESLPVEKRVQSFGSSLKTAQDLINPFSLFNFSAVQNASRKDKSDLRQIGMAYFLYMFIFSGLEYTLTFLVHRRFQYTSMQQGRMFFFMGLIMAIVQGGFLRRIQPGKEKRIALLGMFLLIPSFLIISLSYALMQYYIGLTLFSFASATVVPCMTTVVTLKGSDDQKGTIMGIFRSLGALARALGPILSSTYNDLPRSKNGRRHFSKFDIASTQPACDTEGREGLKRCFLGTSSMLAERCYIEQNMGEVNI
ncbi:Major facilitator superfamily domain-containing protein 10 [Holothuria leucospilota]|uniref:Major facilitator superfamily domain-containing protein 10 n=1 Tax=Holothuria leucospilota TaxID=206669 RepID=A0A9Q0YRT1_HOLLE|nr:Major facilitator superfamily domain-containing protein 10 [Holothuria leucospilota]